MGKDCRIGSGVLGCDVDNRSAALECVQRPGVTGRNRRLAHPVYSAKCRKQSGCADDHARICFCLCHATGSAHCTSDGDICGSRYAIAVPEPDVAGCANGVGNGNSNTHANANTHANSSANPDAGASLI